MARKILALVFVLIFVFGWFCSSAYSTVLTQISDYASGSGNVEVAGDSLIEQYFFNDKELISPSDWIKQEQIHVYRDRVVLDIDNPQWAVFTDTNSMDPVIDENSHAIQVIPESHADISVGDIISFKSDYIDGTVIHRVVEIGEDGEGWYCITKGDNNARKDPGVRRFSDIKRKLVGVFY